MVVENGLLQAKGDGAGPNNRAPVLQGVENAVDDGGFARPIGPQDPNYLIFFGVKVNPAHRSLLAVLLV